MPCYELHTILSEPGITWGDIFHFPGEMIRNPITDKPTPYEQRFVVSGPVENGRIPFWPMRSDGATSVSVDDMEGAYCNVDAMKYFRLAWEAMNP